MAQFAPPGKFHVLSESVVGDVTVPGSYLHSAFVYIRAEVRMMFGLPTAVRRGQGCII